MADIQAQMPVKLTDNTNTVAIVGTALKVDGSAVTQPVTISGTILVDSEMPAAIALSDSIANPTSPMVGAGLMVFDGTAWGRARSFDLDSGAGVQVVMGVGLRKAASGGSVEFGTPADPIRIDPTGTTTQPISGSVTVTGTPAVDTELPAAALLSDTVANPTTPMVGAANMVWDSTNTVWVRTKSYDGDSGAGTEMMPGVMIRLPKSGGSAAGGTSTDPIRIDPTGTTTQPISGSVTVTGTPAVDTELPTAAALSDATGNPTAPMVGAGLMVFDGTAWGRARSFDLDSGAGVQVVMGVGLRKAASGGSVEFGTSADPIRMDPTGTTTQPISGSVTVTGTPAVDTELPAAAAMTDALANPTAPMVASAGLLWNGTTWSRMKGYDLDTGAGTEYVQGIVLRTGASGASIETGTAANPLFVSSGAVTTGVVNFSSTVSAIANAAVGTITYTVTVAKTLMLKSIIAAASGGPCKVVVDYGAGPTLLTTVFFSTAQPYVQIIFAQPIAIVASTAVNVKITNNAGLAQDVYATINGLEI